MTLLCKPRPRPSGSYKNVKRGSCMVCGGDWAFADGTPECPGYSPGDVLRASIGNGPWPEALTESPQELTERLWAEYGEPGEPWPYPGVYIVKTPVTEDDKRVAAFLRSRIVPE